PSAISLRPKPAVSVPLRQPHGFEGRGTVHESLDANDAPVQQIDDDRRVDRKLYPAPLAALVFAEEDDHTVTSIDELLWLDLMLVPCLLDALVVLPDLAEATQDTAFIHSPGSPMLHNVRINQVRHPVPIHAC